VKRNTFLKYNTFFACTVLYISGVIDKHCLIIFFDNLTFNFFYFSCWQLRMNKLYIFYVFNLLFPLCCFFFLFFFSVSVFLVPCFEVSGRYPISWVIDLRGFLHHNPETRGIFTPHAVRDHGGTSGSEMFPWFSFQILLFQW
jgi:hypothetical protein